MTARDALDGMKGRLEAALFHAPYVADGRRVVQANNHPNLLPYVLSDNSMPVIADFIAAAPTDAARLIGAVEAVLARLDEWDSYKAWPDAEETQVWYSAGKRHASEAIRALITEALEESQ